MLSTYDAALARRDSAIPALPTLLDGEALTALLRRALPQAEIETIHARYVRYKPGMNCLVAYHLVVDGTPVQAYAKAYRADAQEPLKKVRRRPALRGPLGAGRIVLPEQGLALSVFPNDSRLAALARMGDTSMRQQLLGRIFPGATEIGNNGTRLLAYKPERRCVLALLGPDRPHAVLKFYTAGGYAAARTSVDVISSRDMLLVPRRIGRSSRHHILAFEWLAGDRLSEELAAPHLRMSAVGTVGAALSQVHAQRPRVLAELRAETEAAALLSLGEDLAFLCPELAGRIDGLARRLAAELMEQRTAARRPLHGDFYAKQVLLAGEQAIILDFDAACVSDPAADIGLFIAHIERDALRGDLPPQRMAAVQEAFLVGYGDATGKPLPEGVALRTAVGLFKLAPHAFRNRDPNWPAAIAAVIERAEAIAALPQYSNNTFRSSWAPAECARPAAVFDDPFGASSDPAMPFIRQALDPVAAAPLLQSALAELAGPGRYGEIAAARVVRHKPGRRCLIEYDVTLPNLDGPTRIVTIVGKARARGLDTNAYHTLQGFARAGFDAQSTDGIMVPTPLSQVHELQMWLQMKVPGIVASELMTGEGSIALARRIADAIHKVHHAGVKTAKKHPIGAELSILHERLPLVAAAHPEWGERIERILDCCDTLGKSIRPHTPVGIHRDFYADQVLIHGPQLYLLDFDLYCAGDPALDVGNFAGHLIEQGLRMFGDPEALLPQAEALVERYVELSGQPNRQAIGAYTTLTLARHIHLSTLFPSRQHCTAALLELCERRLGIGRRIYTLSDTD